MKDPKYRDGKEFTFWADNCSADPDKVTLKYLEKGHTVMSADPFHARVEKGMRAKKMIHDFDDFQAVVAKYGKPLPTEQCDFHSLRIHHFHTQGGATFASCQNEASRPLHWRHKQNMENEI